VKSWILKVELDGEWEECTFATRLDALAAFKAVAADYKRKLKRAVLHSSDFNGETAAGGILPAPLPLNSLN
jgi:hypothetical protein